MNGILSTGCTVVQGIFDKLIWRQRRKGSEQDSSGTPGQQVGVQEEWVEGFHLKVSSEWLSMHTGTQDLPRHFFCGIILIFVSNLRNINHFQKFSFCL